MHTKREWRGHLHHWISFASSLFYMGRPNRFVICISIQSSQPPPGRPHRTHTKLSNYDCESESDRRSPQVEAKSLAVFSGAAAWHRTWGCGSGKAPQNVSGSSILPTPGRKEPFFTYLTILPRNQRHRTNKRPQKPDPRTTSSVVQSNGRARG